jgi:hypothetical protein
MESPVGPHAGTEYTPQCIKNTEFGNLQTRPGQVFYQEIPIWVRMIAPEPGHQSMPVTENTGWGKNDKFSLLIKFRLEV